MFNYNQTSSSWIPNTLYTQIIQQQRDELERVKNKYYNYNVVRNSHILVKLIKRVDNDKDTLSEYMRVATDNITAIAKQLGLFSETSTIIHNGEFSNGLDIVLSYTEYTNDDVLRCISHPYDMLDYVVADQSWGDVNTYVVWGLNVYGLLKGWFNNKSMLTVNEYVYNVIVDTMDSIFERSILNHYVMQTKYKENKHHIYTSIPILRIDKIRDKPILGTTIDSHFNKLPSLRSDGYFNGLILPNVYRTSYMELIFGISRIREILTLLECSGGTLTRLNKLNLYNYGVNLRKLMKYNNILPERYVAEVVDNLNVLITVR